MKPSTDQIQINDTNHRPPLMGWASWNQFGVNISDSIIMAQADAMATSGLATAGYQYINIDDGFFNGRGENGELLINMSRFPNGMKVVADYIHSKGLKAGFYAEAGINTCGSIWSGDEGGVGGGLFGHDQQDIDSIFLNWGYDFIKVDFCGGKEQKLDEETRYRAIKDAITKTGRSDINYNICRWQYPGRWVTTLADSWRISHDINFKPGSVPQWSQIVSIIDINTYLAPYASPGHYNDMDMLEVGRGLSYEEDKSHFSMWCIMSSPLLMGHDMTNMSQQTFDILTNEEVLAVNQDSTALQAQLIWQDGIRQVWAKKLNGKQSNERAVVLFNRGEEEAEISVSLNQLHLSGPAEVRDLWAKKTSEIIESHFTATVPPHGVVMFKITGKANVLQEVFEAEYAWINNFNLTRFVEIVPDQGRVVKDVACASGAKVAWLGNDIDNYLEFRDVFANTSGLYDLTIFYLSGEDRNAFVSVNGTVTKLADLNSGGWDKVGEVTISVGLNAGSNSIRILNAEGWLPDIDKIKIDLKR